MKRCIFCSEQLTKNTPPEHILHNALGGRKTTKQVICGNCNNAFGGTIDKALTSQVELIRNHLQLKSGAGKPPPMIRGMQAGDTTFDYRKDGTPKKSGKPFTVEIEDNNVSVSVETSSFGEFEKLIPNIAAQAGISPEELTKQMMQEEFTITSIPLNRVRVQQSFGGTDAIRSMAKSCLILWATVVGNDHIRSSPFSDVRNFIAVGSETYNEQNTHMDTRSIPCDRSLTSRYGDFYNLVFVQSDHRGRTIGHFTLYNMTSWQILLSPEGSLPNTAVGLISNPINPSIWSDKFADQFSISSTWLKAPVSDDFDSVTRRMAKMTKYHVELGQKREIGRIVDETIAKYDFDADGIMSEIHHEKIFNEIADRMAHFAIRQQHSRKLTFSEIKNLFRKT